MSDRATRDEVLSVLGRINTAWLDEQPQRLVPLLHPDISVARPGFSGRSQGRDAVALGFVDFREHANVPEYHEADRHVDVVGDTAVATYTYTMVHERGGSRRKASGRDLWVFARDHAEGWRAVWRTMLDVRDQPA